LEESDMPAQARLDMRVDPRLKAEAERAAAWMRGPATPGCCGNPRLFIPMKAVERL
jgi:hypothetical protein